MMLDQVAAVLLAGLLPFWIMFGLADWQLHRRSAIAATSGWRESAFHLLLTAQAGFAVLLALFLEINSLVILVIIVAFVAHEITTYLDVRYAAPLRDIVPLEQRVHDYLTAMPFAALFLVIAAHPQQTLGIVGGIVGLSDAPADWTLRVKDVPYPTWYVAGFLAASSLNALAYLEEFRRCWRARRV